MTNPLDVSALENHLAEVIARVSSHRERVLLTRDDRPMAALVPVDDLRRLEQLDREWDERTAAIKRFSEAFADVSAEEAEAEVTRIIAERRKRRAEEAERRSA